MSTKYSNIRDENSQGNREFSAVIRQGAPQAPTTMDTATFLRAIFQGAPETTYTTFNTIRKPTAEEKENQVKLSCNTYAEPITDKGRENMVARAQEAVLRELNAYFRVSFLTVPPERGKRGKACDSYGAACVWADCDYYNIPGMTLEAAIDVLF